MGRTACTEPQCLYKCAYYLFISKLIYPLQHSPCVLDMNYTKFSACIRVLLFISEKGTQRICEFVAVTLNNAIIVKFSRVYSKYIYAKVCSVLHTDSYTSCNEIFEILSMEVIPYQYMRSVFHILMFC